VQIASGLGRAPLFPAINSLDLVFLPADVIMQAALPDLTHLTRLDDDDEEAMAQGRALFLLLRRILHSRRSSAVSASNIRSLMNAADVAFLTFLFGADHRGNADRRRILSLVTAGHLFLYAALRGVPRTGLLTRVMLQRLRNNLEDYGGSLMFWEGSFTALVWLYFLGVAVAAPGESEWFRVRLATVLPRLVHDKSIKTKGQLQKSLELFLWHDGLFQPALDACWDEMSLVQVESVDNLDFAAEYPE
jgi:hypothetical protein